MKKLFTLIIAIMTFQSLSAQGTAGETAKFEHRTLIDMPTAGILEKGFVGPSIDILPGGALIAILEVGVFDDISFGISYGGSNIIGAGNPGWYDLPAVNIKFRLFEESLTMPAIALGFDSQGKGEYFDSTSRYAIKSPGFFAVASKNFEILGYLSLHGGINYSLEGEDGDNFLNMYFGFEKTIGKVLSVVGEYDFALNDNTTNMYGTGNGYLNLGVRWSLAEGFTLGFDLRDLLKNKKWSPSSADRSVKIEYIKNIF